MSKKRCSIQRAFGRFKRLIVHLLRGLTFLCPFCPILPKLIHKYKISKSYNVLELWSKCLEFEMLNFFNDHNHTKKQQRHQFDTLIKQKKIIFEEMDLYKKWNNHVFISSESKDNFIQYLKIIWKSIQEYKEISERACILVEKKQQQNVACQTDSDLIPYTCLSDISETDIYKILQTLPHAMTQALLFECNKQEIGKLDDEKFVIRLLQNVSDRDQKHFLSEMSTLLQQSPQLLFTLQYNYFHGE